MAKYEPSHLREMNTWIVFQEFRRHPSQVMFSKEIARTVRISDPTVIKITEFLFEKGLISAREDIEEQGKIGRKPRYYSLDTEKYYSIGILFEGEYLTLGIVNIEGCVTNYIQVACKGSLDDVILKEIDKLLRVSGRTTENLAGIGIGVPCIYDKNTEMIEAPLIGVNKPTSFKSTIDKIKDRFKVSVSVDNDVNMLAYGEYMMNPEKYGKEDMIYISLGTGLGAGIIINGKIRQGQRNICGEVGYMKVPDGRGNWEQLETLINMKAIAERYHSEKLTETQKTDAAEYLSGYLAALINNLIVTVDANYVVLGGLVPDLIGDELFIRTQEKYNNICLRPLEILKKESLLPGISGSALIATDRYLTKLFAGY